MTSIGMQHKRSAVTHLSQRGLILGVFVTAVTMACGNEPLPKAAGPQPANVVLSDLLANPIAYDGALLRVSGWCSVAFEGNALWLDKETYERNMTDRAVWLNLGWPVSDDIRALDRMYVVVEGRFDGYQKGHEAQFKGMFSEVSRIERTSATEQAAPAR